MNRFEPSDTNRPPIVILGLGNDVMGDDAVALHVCAALQRDANRLVEVIASPVAGLALIDFLEGRERAILLDSISTGNSPPGTLHFLTPEDFAPSSASSPHFLGIHEILSLAKELNIPIPADLRIIAMEIERSSILRIGLSETIEASLPRYVDAVRGVLTSWLTVDALS